MVKTEFKPKKYWGQNFFTNKDKVKDIIRLLDINFTDEIVEIGGGMGIFTKEIIKQDPKLFQVYEIDPILANHLNKKLGVITINENFLDAQIANHGQDSVSQKWKIFGAIPYNITSPIIHKLMRTKNRPDTIVLIIQAEVADKLTSNPPRGNYWSHITSGYSVKTEMTLPASDFEPKPKVDSKVVSFKLVPKEFDEDVQKIGFTNWSQFLHHVFKNPRKMLNKVFDKEILAQIDTDPKDRPHNLTTEQIIKLYDILHSR